MKCRLFSSLRQRYSQSHLDQNFNLNINHDAIAHDLQNSSKPTTVIGFIVEAIRRRYERGLAPFTTLSCDNLPRNGEILKKAVLSYAEQLDPQLADYISNHATFPNTVVDCIVPQRITLTVTIRISYCR